MRSLFAITVAVASISGAWNAGAQQPPCSTPKNIFSAMARSSPVVAAQEDFERAVCEYRNCVQSNPNNVNACEGLRHIMDASAVAAGRYNSSR
jgi:hypothetical protein